MELVITDIGMTKAIDASINGWKIKLKNFKLGGGYNYPIDKTRTSLQGSIVHIGDFLSVTPVGNNNLLFVLRIDESVGDFHFGEMGIFMDDGTLFAYTVFQDLEWKFKDSISQPGNIIQFEVRIRMDNVVPVIDYTHLNVTNIPMIGSINNLPMASTAQSNAFIISDPGKDDRNLGFIATKRSNVLWNFTEYRYIYTVGNITKITGTGKIEIAGWVKPTDPFIQRKYIMQIRTGTLRSVCRFVIQLTDTGIWFDLANDNGLNWTHLKVGDQVEVLHTLIHPNLDDLAKKNHTHDAKDIVTGVLAKERVGTQSDNNTRKVLKNSQTSNAVWGVLEMSDITGLVPKLAEIDNHFLFIEGVINTIKNEYVKKTEFNSTINEINTRITNVEGSVSNIDMSHLVTLATDQTISGKKNFSKDINIGSSVYKLNGDVVAPLWAYQGTSNNNLKGYIDSKLASSVGTTLSLVMADSPLSAYNQGIDRRINLSINTSADNQLKVVAGGLYVAPVTIPPPPATVSSGFIIQNWEAPNGMKAINNVQDNFPTSYTGTTYLDTFSTNVPVMCKVIKIFATGKGPSYQFSVEGLSLWVRIIAPSVLDFNFTPNFDVDDRGHMRETGIKSNERYVVCNMPDSIANTPSVITVQIYAYSKNGSSTIKRAISTAYIKSLCVEFGVSQ